MAKERKIYTRTGDRGETSLLGGTRVPKYHDRIEAYGTLDELNSFIGLLRDKVTDPGVSQVLFEIQDRIFTAEALVAAEPDSDSGKLLPLLSEPDVELLEKEMDRMNLDLPALTSFILPGGHELVSLCHICRTVCRRAERLTIRLSHNSQVDSLVIRYLNRLSDYFFVLSRKISKDEGIPDQIWRPRV